MTTKPIIDLSATRSTKTEVVNLLYGAIKRAHKDLPNNPDAAFRVKIVVEENDGSPVWRVFT